MTIDLDAIQARYQAALDAKPSKGDYTPDGVTALTDSVCDIPDLLAQNRRYANRIADLARTHQNILDAGLRAGRIQGLRQAAEYADASINWDGETSPRRLTRDSLGQWLRDRATDLETGAE